MGHAYNIFFCSLSLPISLFFAACLLFVLISLTVTIFQNIYLAYLSNTEKNGFVTATKLGTTNKFFVAATENFAAATKCFLDRTKHFVVVTKNFGYPYFNK